MQSLLTERSGWDPTGSTSGNRSTTRCLGQSELVPSIGRSTTPPDTTPPDSRPISVERSQYAANVRDRQAGLLLEELDHDEIFRFDPADETHDDERYEPDRDDERGDRE